MREKILKAKAAMPLPDLLRHYGLGDKAKKSANSPFRTNSDSGAFGIFQKDDGAWHWKDFVTDEHGDEIDFIEKYENRSKKDSIIKFLEIAGIPTNDSEPLAKIINGESPQEAQKNNSAFQWDKYVEMLDDAKSAEIANWRVFSCEFIRSLREKKLIGLFNGNVAFPVGDSACHWRVDDMSWRYAPKGCGTSPLVIGDIASANEIHVFESQWDALAVMYALKWHEGACDQLAFIATRGASNGSVLSDVLPETFPETTRIIAWPQNDPVKKRGVPTPAEKWLEDIREASGKHGLLRATVPQQHKDANDWLRAGATFDDFLLASDTDPKSIIDLTPYFTGEMEMLRPTVAEIWNGKFLFYSGRTNSLHGPPSAGKTNILLCAAKAVLASGGSVLYIDPEDTPHGIAVRARSLGLLQSDVSRLLYIQNPTPEDYAEIIAWAKYRRPTLVILDGLAEALAAEALDENSPADVLQFFRTRTRPFADAGAAVVIADHVVKGEGDKRFARGSGAKLANYNGAVYEVALGASYTPEVAGFVKLKIAKDRNGGAGPQGQWVTELHFSPGDEGITSVQWRKPDAKEDFRPTSLMEKVVEHLKTYGEAGKRDLRGLGNSNYVDKAITLLLDEGKIVRRRIGTDFRAGYRFSLAEKSPA